MSVQEREFLKLEIMPKVRSKRRIQEGPDVLGSREVSKLRKLIQDNVEEESSPIRSSYIVKISADESESEDLPVDFFDNLPEASGHIDEDWQAFLDMNKDKRKLTKELEHNLLESRNKVNENISNFSGSVFGDLEESKGFDNVDELPEELHDHLKLLIDVLKHYRSGSLPKTVKMLPHLPGWEGLLEILKPLEWSVHVFPRIVKIFASKGHEPALHFYENYLLPKVKQDIEENGRLCFHLFEALIASMFRAEEFLSGLLLPWLQSDMSKTEGVILSHLLKKATLKSRFAAVALALTLEEEFSIPRSMVIETLLSKRYHLPKAALSRVTQYFLSFDKNCSVHFTTEQRMPITWFKSLLTFIEFYRNCLSVDDKEQLLKLCRRHDHPQITKEIRSFLNLIKTE